MGKLNDPLYNTYGICHIDINMDIKQAPTVNDNMFVSPLKWL